MSDLDPAAPRPEPAPQWAPAPEPEAAPAAAPERAPAATGLVHPNPPSDPLFAPPGGVWRRLSPRYVRVRRLGTIIGCVLVFVPLGVASWFLWQLPWVTGAVAAVALAWTVWRLVRARRWVESWGWAERDQDLCITHGLWSRHLVVVPFGRMQVVTVTSGPLLRANGLAEVQLVTAAALSDAKIPGLDQADAIALRDRMIELSDARGAGL